MTWALQQDLYRELAVRRGGKVARRPITLLGIEVSSELEFRHRIGPVVMRLDLSSDSKKAYQTACTIEGPFRIPRFEIYPEMAVHGIAKLFFMQDIQIDIPWFDARYILKCEQPRYLIEKLGEENRDRIDRLRRASPLMDELYIHAQSGAFSVQVKPQVLDIELLARLHDDTWSLFSGLTGYQIQPLDGIEIVGVSDPATAAWIAPAIPEIPELPPSTADMSNVTFDTAGVCPVCGGALGKLNLVRCAGCQTAHHFDCWHWNQRCAIYGCRTRLEA